MKFRNMIYRLLLVVVVLSAISCKDEYSSMGSDIVGNQNLAVNTTTLDVVAYNKPTGAFQSNGLSVNQLGVLNDPVFGKTIASYVTQLKFPTAANPVANIENATVLKVELTVPYFSTHQETEQDGTRKFKLDSLITDTEAKIRLNVYESGYYLNDFDPNTNFEDAQKYYTDLYDVINANKVGNRLNNATEVAQNDAFFFDKAEHLIYETNNQGVEVVKERIDPQMKLELDKDFFQQKIFNAPAGQMDSNNNFHNYFKGLFFQVEDLGLGSHLAMLDFSKGKITIHYNTPSMSSGTTGTVVFNFGGNSAMLIQSHPSTAYANALVQLDSISGNANLYVKGGEGSAIYVDLFKGEDADNNGFSDVLDQLRTQAQTENWLINEANLVFYVNQDLYTNTYFPHRIFIHDTKTHLPLMDYYSDNSRAVGKPKFDKFYHSGIVFKQDNKPYKYTIRITKHIQALLKNNDTKNNKLGITITENIGMISMGVLKNNENASNANPYKFLPITSVMSPLGMVFYGNNVQNQDKKLKLEIQYTKP
ncbi:MAG: DUF4270 domain-containing protein [Bacteroidota bacterium]|nr:DUF4270 domain-containing protein [Bacteroidota bacterium]